MPEDAKQPAAAPPVQAGAPKAPAGSLYGIHTVIQSVFVSAISPGAQPAAVAFAFKV